MKKDVALVLSGGGARGYAHIGAIKVLEEHGFRITSVAGTSMGALVGGIYAAGYLPQFEEWLISLDIKEVLRQIDFVISKKGFIKGKKIIDKIREIAPVRNIEDLSVPFCAVATNIQDETEIVFNEGDFFEAIRASISIPTVFQPYQIGETIYVDGGILNPLPVNRVRRSGNDLLVVVDVNASVPYEKNRNESEFAEGNDHADNVKQVRDKLARLMPDHKTEGMGLLYLSNKSIGIMTHKISELTLEKYKPDLLVSVSRESFNIFEFYKAKEIIREGEEATLNALKTTNLSIDNEVI
jgi:NTE family protein